MKVYVAGRTSSVMHVRAVQEIVRDLKGEITFDWTGAAGEIRTSWWEHPDRAREIATTERQAVEDADIVVLVNHKDGVGMYIEVGMALAQHKDVIVWNCGARDSVFWYLPGVVQCDQRNDVYHVLKSYSEGDRSHYFA